MRPKYRQQWSPPTRAGGCESQTTFRRLRVGTMVRLSTVTILALYHQDSRRMTPTHQHMGTLGQHTPPATRWAAV